MLLCGDINAFMQETIFPNHLIRASICIVAKEVRLLVSNSLTTFELDHGYPGRPSMTNSTCDER
jgi:hypothetical protein